MSLRPIPSELIPARTSFHRGHSHFWERALSRRQFLGTAVGSAAVIAGSGLLDPTRVISKDMPVRPKPLPSGTQFGGPGTPVFRIYFPGMGNENSAITDFDGMVGATDIRGMGTGTHLNTGKQTRYLFDTDLRFMKGKFVGTDGKAHQGTFGFV